MDRPDFGIGKYHAVKWTAERVDYLRYAAGLGMSAAEIALDIFGTDTKAKTISMACRKHGVRLNGRPGRRPHVGRPIMIQIPERHLPTITTLATRYRLAKIDVVHQLLAAMFGQGEAFCDNLLDLASDE